MPSVNGPVEVLAAADADVLQRRAARSLRSRGLGEGDRVGVCVTGGVAQLSVIAGALRAGIVPVVVNPVLTLRERDVIRRDADPALWLDDANSVSELLAGIPAQPADVSHLPLGRPMHYTSGTTGVPKGVWTGVLDEGRAESLWGEEIRQWGFGPDDVHLVCSPLQHSAPIRFAIATWLAGGRVVVPPKFSAGDLPDITPRTIESICLRLHVGRPAAVLARTDRVEPCIGIYLPAARPWLAGAAARWMKGLAMPPLHSLIPPRLRVEVPITAAEARNVNRPEDLAAPRG
jgi:long-chain acyl-CoA synthetase